MDITSPPPPPDEWTTRLLVLLQNSGGDSADGGAKRLVDLGLDSLSLVRIHGMLELQPKPSLLELYNMTSGRLHQLLVNVPRSRPRPTFDDPVVAHGDGSHGRPFQLTELQESYYIGRYESQRFCPCTVYSEFDFGGDLQLDVLQSALRVLVSTHPMLRAGLVDGRQVIPTMDEAQLHALCQIPVSMESDHDGGGGWLESRRTALRTFQPDEGDRFWKLEATRLVNGNIRLHILFDMLFMDASSASVLVHSVVDAYNQILGGRGRGETPKAALSGSSFLDYCTLIQRQTESASSRDYWLNLRIPDPPQLPRASSTSKLLSTVSFDRVSCTISAPGWSTLKSRATHLGVTPTSLLLASFAQVVRFYAAEPDFSLTLTTSSRSVQGYSFDGVVGDFTNVLVCPMVDADVETDSFVQLIARVHQTLASGLEHSDMSGLKVMRMLRERVGDPNLTFPVVFTSLLGLDWTPTAPFIGLTQRPELVFQRTQTPQVWLDHQLYETAGALHVNWDFDPDFYDLALVSSMRDAHERLLHRIAAAEAPLETWAGAGGPIVTLSPREAHLRQVTNDTFKLYPAPCPTTLHGLFDRQVAEYGSKTAVIDDAAHAAGVRLSYKQLDRLASHVSSLVSNNCWQHSPNQNVCVAIVMEKGWEQVVGVLGVLRSGGTYLPINPSDPDARIAAILRLADCRLVLTQKKLVERFQKRLTSAVIDISTECLAINIDDDDGGDRDDEETRPEVDPNSVAYIIFTSGTEGEPKGVEISHAGAVNTILDINDRFGVNSTDTTFAISSLSFDLSVWDIFGTLGAGGTVVICKPDGTRDPDYWWDQIKIHDVTIWNSVPTSFEMLLEAQPETAPVLPLRLALLSGDGTRSEFATSVKRSNPNLRLICLGGATEASIWSNYHEVELNDDEPLTASTELVPYGRPLSNQTLHVLGGHGAGGHHRPDRVIGEIYIGGAGLAVGYFKNPAKTAEAFVQHPIIGTRLYKTGDLGRYMANGEVEIIGRRDTQVKVGGHRVELSEIETVAGGVVGVRAAVVVPRAGAGGGAGDKQLLGFLLLERNQSDSREIVAAVVQEVRSRLPDYMFVGRWLTLSTLPLNRNGKVDRKACLEIAEEEEAKNAPLVHPQCASNDDGNDDLVTKILAIARSMLDDKYNRLTLSGSLIEFGMTSLVGIRFSRRLTTELGVTPQLPHTLVFNYPSVAQIAEYIKGLRLGATAATATTVTKSDGGESSAIAVIGMSCRLPGGVRNTEEFWTLLCEGRDAMSEVPDSRFDISKLQEGCVTKRGAFLDPEDLELFDNTFFDISDSEAREMDPQQRLFMQVAYEAFHRAGLDKAALSGSNTGVFVGQMNYDWMNMVRAPQLYAGTGSSPSITSNRLSFALGLHGPSLSVDTACSSSLVALHLAVEALRASRCSTALVGGVNVILAPDLYLTTSAAGMLSPDGRCATFDYRANGIARGEGVGAVVLKRLSAAMADGDPILAVIRGTAVNQDGRSATLTAPNGHAQRALIQSALADAGVLGSQIDYVECHGTGTQLGDPIEVEALCSVLCGLPRVRTKNPVLLGAVKTNFGHLEGAAGIVGFIKTVLVLQHGQVPPNVHFEKLNPSIIDDVSSGGVDIGVTIPTKITPLLVDTTPTTAPAIAGVSSFGFGGTNAHAVLQAWDGAGAGVGAGAGAGRPKEIELGGFDSSVCWLFSGQGCEYAGMGAQLYQTNPVFKACLDECASLSAPHVATPLLDLLFDSQHEATLLRRTSHSQLATFALQVSLARMWEAKGVRPAVVVGHSLGEYAAAVVCGHLKLETAIELVAARGRLMEGLTSREGAMLAVRAPAEELRAALTHGAGAVEGAGVYVAAVNGQNATVLSGERQALEAFKNKALELANSNWSFKWLPTCHAFHSPLMEPMLGEFRTKLDSALDKTNTNALPSPSRPVFVSSVTGQVETDATLLTTEYWLNQITSPVQFLGAIETILSLRSPSLVPNTFMEIGPDSTLLNMTRRIVGRQSQNQSQNQPYAYANAYQWVESLRRDGTLPRPPCLHIFNPKRFPWDVQKRLGKSSALAVSASNPSLPTTKLYKTIWEDCVNTSSTSKYQVHDIQLRLEKEDWLLVSFAPISTEGTRWTNLVIEPSTETTDLIREAFKNRAAPWSTIAFVADDPSVDRDSEQVFEIGLSLLTKVEAGQREAVHSSVWFFTSPGLWGLARSARLELPDRAIRCVDCPTPASSFQIAKLCAKALAVGVGAENEFRMRPGRPVQVPRFVGLDPKKARILQRVIDTNATYIIAGGLGALGLLVARWLLEKGATHLVLLYKTQRDSAHVSDLLKELTCRVRVVCLQCDVSERGQVEGLRDKLTAADGGWPPVRGVVHAAGVLADGTLTSLTQQDVRTAFSHKVRVAQNLHDTFPPFPRDGPFLILFSSAAAVFGSAGQANYCAANTTMDALAEEWAKRGEDVLSIQWGPFAEGGMAVTAAGATKGTRALERLERQGISSILNSEAMDILEQVILKEPQTGTLCAVKITDWTAPAALRGNPKFAKFQALGPKALDHMDAPTHPNLATILSIVRAAVLDIGFNLSDSQPLMDAGVSSLDLVSLRSQLITAFPKLKIPTAVAFNYPTISELATYLHTQMVAVVNANLSPSASPVSVRDADVWERMNKETNVRDTPNLFLVGGVLGTAKGTFSRLAQHLPCPVYATIPNLELHSSIPSLATSLIQSMRSLQPEGPYFVGGLSFGSLVAIEMAIQLQNTAVASQSAVGALVLLDPRHVPPFEAPSDSPAAFELLVAAYSAGTTQFLGNTLLVRVPLPDFGTLSPLLKEAARSFQPDHLVDAGCTRLCPNLRIEHCPGHHFNFLNSHCESLAGIIEGELKRTKFDPGSISRVMSSAPEVHDTAVAVIGAACRFPGSANSLEAFWTVLAEQRDCVTEVPFGRFSMDSVYNPAGGLGKSYTNRAAFIDNLEWFDHDMFGISAAEAVTMDPQQRALLEVTYEAFLAAGLERSSLSGSNTGVCIGQANYDWMGLHATSQAAPSPYTGAGTSASITANRLSYILGLQGPSMVTDTACSSSLVALDVAVSWLRAGKCSLALVGGVNAILSPHFFVNACATGALSRVGRCATFDAGADGYTRGEGVGAVVLKSLAQAQADGDSILAVIRGTAVNQDGRSASLTAPNGRAQEAVIQAALQDAGVFGNQIDYVECHGTGTELGDPIELEALKNALGKDRSKPLFVGAVKTNIGHLEGAAGIAGLIKTILVLRHKTAPGLAHLQRINPKIDLDGFPIVIPQKASQIGHKSSSLDPLFAGVSSFGFGGTNAHAILQAWPGGSSSRGRSHSRSPVAVSFNRRFIPWRRLPHPLLYHRVTDSTFVGKMSGELAHIWNDHRINGVVWTPAASHLTMAAGILLETQRKAGEPSIQFVSATSAVVEMSDVTILQPLRVKPGLEVKCSLVNDSSVEISYEDDDDDDGARPIVCAKVGRVFQHESNHLQSIDLESVKERCTMPVDMGSAYKMFESLGVQFGPSFRTVLQAWEGTNEMVARIGLSTSAPPRTSWERSLYLVHPALLDGALQLIGLTAIRTAGICVPFHIERALLVTQSEQSGELWAHVRLTSSSAERLTGDIVLASSSGAIVAIAEGVESRRVVLDGLTFLNDVYETEWVPVPIPSQRQGAENRHEDMAHGSTSTSTILSRVLLLSFTPVPVVEGPESEPKLGWTNLQISPDTLDRLDTQIRSEEWSSIIYLSDRPNAVDSVQTGLAILKVIEGLTRSGGHVPVLWFVSGNGLNDTQGLAAAGLLAIARTARIELPELKLNCVSFDPDLNSSSTVLLNSSTEIAKLCANILLSTLSSSSSSAQDIEFEFRVGPDESLRVPRLRRLKLEGSEDKTNGVVIKPDVTYLISGGLGALGLVFAKWLLAQGANRVVLISRNKIPEKELRILVGLDHDDHDEGTHVMSLPCDVSVAEEVQGLRDTLHTLNWPEVSGVIHAAGILSDATLSTLDPSALQACVSPKVVGAQNLRSTFNPPDFMVLFSSASAVFGSPGQACYAAANGMLDALAETWQKSGRGRVLSVQWGPWSEGGMAAHPEILRRAERSGFGSISNELGAQVLSHLLGTRTRTANFRRGSAICVTPVKWSRITFRSPFFGHFLPKTAKTVNSVPRAGASRPTSGLSSRDERETRAIVRQVLVSVLGHEIQDDEPIIDAGLDSLGAIEFRNRLSTSLRTEIPATIVFNYPTIEQMVEFLSGVGGQPSPVIKQLAAPISQLNSTSTSTNEPIAIIGWSCKLPGGVSSPSQFWSMLQEIRDCTSEIPSYRLDMDGVYDPSPSSSRRPGTTYTKRAGLMSELEWFDSKFFNISTAEAQEMDPQHRILLEVSYEAFVSAGYDKKSLAGSRTGVFIGQANYDWLSGDKDMSSPYFGVGSSASITSNRISFTFGLSGPSMTIDTACSSSLVALDLAVGKIRAGKCQTALVGGVNTILTTKNFIGSCSANMLSAKGRCATFDASADGYCRGEGVGAVVLKSLSQAQVDGDSILAVIRGTAVNQDGRSASLTAPNGRAQEAVIQAALQDAGISGNQIDYVECHGTGTELGDPIELEALKNALGADRTKPLFVGAVKTNIGHLEGAAGIAGLIKTILVLRHKSAPGLAHLQRINPKIDLEGFQVVIPQKSSPIGHSGSGSELFAGVSSFGFGGTNAHVILQGWPEPPEPPRRQSSVTFTRQFLPWRRLPHPLLYHRASSGSSSSSPRSFVGKMTGELAHIWDDHRINGVVWTPAASHLTMAGGALLDTRRKPHAKEFTQFVSSTAVELNDLTILKPLRVSPGLVVKCSLDNADGSGGGAEISYEDSSDSEIDGRGRSEICVKVRHVTEKNLAALPTIDLELIKQRCTKPMDIARAYKSFEDLGVQFGPSFRTVLQAWEGPAEMVARIGLPTSAPPRTSWERSLYLIHPALLDGALQLLGLTAMTQTTTTTGMCVPFHIERALLAPVPHTESNESDLWAHAVLTSKTADGLSGDVVVTNSAGQTVAVLEGVESRRVVDNVLDNGKSFLNHLYETEWVPVEGGQGVGQGTSSLDAQPVLSHVLVISGGPRPSNLESDSELGLTYIHQVDDLDDQIRSKAWSSIVYLSQAINNNSAVTDAVDSVQIGLIILKAIENLARNSSGGRELPHLWFIAEDDVTGAGLLALAKTARIELPDLNLTTIMTANEVSNSKPINSSAELLRTLRLSQTHEMDTDFKLGVEGKFLVPRLQRLKARPSPIEIDDQSASAGVAIKPNTTYLISGGLGALGLVFAKWLLAEGATHVVLISRRKVPKSELRELLGLPDAHDEGSAPFVMSVACDVSVASHVHKLRDTLLTLEWPDVSGVIHAAGILSDATLSTLDPSALQACVSPKVHGAQNLWSTFNPPDFMVLFSSASAVFGSPGQACYAAANGMLDALAETWQKSPHAHGERGRGRVLSVQWGPWSEGGMAAHPETLKRAERSGFGSISNDMGQKVLSHLLGGRFSSAICVTPIKWSRMAMTMTMTTRGGGFLENFLPRPRVSALVPLTLSDPKRHGSTETGATGVAKNGGMSLENVRLVVRRNVGLVLGVDAEAVGDDEPLMESGLDSLGSVELRNRLANELNVKLPAVLMFNYPSMEALSSFIHSELGGTGGGQQTAGERAPFLRQILPNSPNKQPIAVIGMSCRLPGGVTSPDELWELLVSGRNTISVVPETRFSMESIYDPVRGRPGKSYTNVGGFIDNADQFDHKFFNISLAEAKSMDPQQRQLLEVGYEAFVEAGYDRTRLKGSDVGVFVGQMNYDWMIWNGLGGEDGAGGATGGYAGTGLSPAISSNRLSYTLGLQGPSLTIDTACSSSLVALDAAVSNLRAGKCGMALVAGANLMLHPQSFIGECAAGMLSEVGRCATFDADADGYTRGEGVGAVVLKSLAQAQADGDSILALILGTAVNQDGRSASLTAPNGRAQEAVIQSALRDAGISGNQMDYVECHGTGTRLGDPIEVGSLKSVLGEGRTKPVVLGALKTNIGHLEGAAGIAGLIKTVLVLRHRQAPPNLHLAKLNPNIELAGFEAVLPREVTNLRTGGGAGGANNGDLIAGVSSFGFGGTNAHVILQSCPPKLRSISQTGSTKSTQPPKERVGLLFTGQGSQFTGMGLEFYSTNKVFKDVLDSCARHLSEVIEVPLLDLLFEKRYEVELNTTRYAQVAIFCVEVALAQMWLSSSDGDAGLEPILVLGHSIGEFAAATVAGVMSLEVGLQLVVERGRLMEQLCESGGMVAVRTSAEYITRVLTNTEEEYARGIALAAVNGPKSVVLSGRREALEKLTLRLSAEGLSFKWLAVNRPFHSPLMSPMLEQFRAKLNSSSVHLGAPLTLTPPGIQFVSTVTGRVASSKDLRTSEYWVQQIWSTVSFNDAMLTSSSMCTTFLEIGPKSVLTPMAKQVLAAKTPKEGGPGLHKWISSADFTERHRGEAQTARIPLFNRVSVPWSLPTIKTSKTPTDMDRIESRSRALAPSAPSIDETLFKTEWTPLSTQGSLSHQIGSNPGAAMLIQPGSNVLIISTVSQDGQEGTNLSVEVTMMADTDTDTDTDATTRTTTTTINLSDLAQIYSLRPWTAIVLVSSGGSTSPAPQFVNTIALGLLSEVANKANSVSLSNKGTVIWLVTHDANEGLSGSGLLAIARTARLELPNLKINYVRVSGESVLNTVSILDKIIAARSRSDGGSDLDVSEFLVDDNATKILVPRLAYFNEHPGVDDLKIGKGTYIISGGLGALGLVFAQWLIDKAKGATHIVLLSRKEPMAESELRALLKFGPTTSVTCFRCDVSQLDQVVALKSWIESSNQPEVASVRGVIHSAGLLHDGTIANLPRSYTELSTTLSAVYNPKVEGALNLHAVFMSESLDFLVLNSSAAALFGSPGQGSYAAANGVMDALAEGWATSSAQPVVSIQWGAWSEGGMAADNPTALRRAERAGFGHISNELGRQILENILTHSKFGVVCACPVDWTRYSKSNVKSIEPPMEIHANAKNSHPIGGGDIEARSQPQMTELVRRIAYEVLGEHVDDETPLLEEAGLDSLGSIEFRNQLASELKVDIPAGILFSFPTVRELSAHLGQQQQLRQKPTSTEPPSRGRSRHPILIIGGGLGGLAFAKTLLEAGRDGEEVIMMESKSVIGGVWRTWANDSSKLQIESPSYDFGIGSSSGSSWPTSFPSRAEILEGAETIARDELGTRTARLWLGTTVNRVTKDEGSNDYVVEYTRGQPETETQTLRVSGVVAMTGGLHVPRTVTYPGESTFLGTSALGIQNDVDGHRWKGARVVIVGHGAFAIENMRTALENGADHVTIVCRRRNLVVSTFCNWLLNSAPGTMPITAVMDVMRPFYAAAGLDLDTLPCFSWRNGQVHFAQSTVPPASDLYFLAQAAGKLVVVEGDEVDHLTQDSVVTKSGRTLKADILLKCLGFETQSSILDTIFGKGTTIDGVWVNGDPHLFAYNDGEQKPSSPVRSLLCSSYLFFVQAFATVYTHYAHARASARDGADSEFNNVLTGLRNGSVLMTQVWDFLSSAKARVAQRTVTLRPFEAFRREREAEWDNYRQLLQFQASTDLWTLIQPVLVQLHERDPTLLLENRMHAPHPHGHGAILSRVLVPASKARVLFLHGQGTNAQIAETLLRRTGWMETFANKLEFVIPDAPFEIPAFTNPEQLDTIGLSYLVENKLYEKGRLYREWGADFEEYAQIWNEKRRGESGTTLSPEVATADKEMKWTIALDYLREVVKRHGPFDGVAGFCEGATVLSVALHLQASGKRDIGLGGVKFLIAMSAWRAPFYEQRGLFANPDRDPLDLPSLHISGDGDMELFKEGAANYATDYQNPKFYKHGGKHVYPSVTPTLKASVLELISRARAEVSGRERGRNQTIHEDLVATIP